MFKTKGLRIAIFVTFLLATIGVGAIVVMPRMASRLTYASEGGRAASAKAGFVSASRNSARSAIAEMTDMR